MTRTHVDSACMDPSRFTRHACAAKSINDGFFNMHSPICSQHHTALREAHYNGQTSCLATSLNCSSMDCSPDRELTRWQEQQQQEQQRQRQRYRRSHQGFGDGRWGFTCPWHGESEQEGLAKTIGHISPAPMHIHRRHQHLVRRSLAIAGENELS